MATSDRQARQTFLKHLAALRAMGGLGWVVRTSIEVFAGDGCIAMCSCFLPDLLNRSLRIYAEGGPAVARSLTAYKLRSAWAR